MLAMPGAAGATSKVAQTAIKDLKERAEFAQESLIHISRVLRHLVGKMLPDDCHDVQALNTRLKAERKELRKCRTKLAAAN